MPRVQADGAHGQKACEYGQDAGGKHEGRRRGRFVGGEEADGHADQEQGSQGDRGGQTVRPKGFGDDDSNPVKPKQHPRGNPQRQHRQQKRYAGQANHYHGDFYRCPGNPDKIEHIDHHKRRHQRDHKRNGEKIDALDRLANESKPAAGKDVRQTITPERRLIDRLHVVPQQVAAGDPGNDPAHEPGQPKPGQRDGIVLIAQKEVKSGQRDADNDAEQAFPLEKAPDVVFEDRPVKARQGFAGLLGDPSGRFAIGGGDDKARLAA